MTWRSASITRAVRVVSFEVAMRWMITSVSEVDWKMEPDSSSCSRSWLALIRLPLWETAMGPLAYSTTNGWAFLMSVCPAVE